MHFLSATIIFFFPWSSRQTYPFRCVPFDALATQASIICLCLTFDINNKDETMSRALRASNTTRLLEEKEDVITEKSENQRMAEESQDCGCPRECVKLTRKIHVRIPFTRRIYRRWFFFFFYATRSRNDDIGNKHVADRFSLARLYFYIIRASCQIESRSSSRLSKSCK